jgi:multidrug efflux system outer membrane protein
MSKVSILIVIALVAGMAGCAVGPNYHRPAPLPDQPVPKQYSDTSTATNHGTWKIAEPAASQPRGEWWQVFNDARLQGLEALALTNNQNLAAAAARIDQSRALVGAARSEFYPQLNAGGTPNGDVTRQRTSVNAPVRGRAATNSFTFNTFTAPVYLGWEIDLWGRVRRQSEAAREEYAASADDYESALLEMTAEVAADYFTLRTLDEEYAVITNTITTYQRSLELTQNRRHGGVASDLDVAQAATQLHSAEAELPAIELRRVQTLHALAVLCGQSPVDFEIPPDTTIQTEVPFVPVSVPSELLEHRPDVASAERLMSAANANIGVAKAAFFPTVRIDGLAGLQSVSAGSLFNADSRIWSIGPSVELPLFTGGLNRANLAAARAAYNAAMATYRQTVLMAFGDVEDQLAAQRLLAEQWEGEYAALDSSRHALEIANNRYKAGLTTYLDVATAQTDTLIHESAVVDLEGARLVAAINLIKALGCGWQQTIK